MDRVASPLRNVLWPAIAIALGLLATAGFLRDLGLRGLHSWELAALLVAGAAIALLTLPRDGLARALVALVAAIAAAFLIAYDVLDTLLDPVIKADWPIAALAAVLIWALGSVLFAIDPEDD